MPLGRIIASIAMRALAFRPGDRKRRKLPKLVAEPKPKTEALVPPPEGQRDF